MDQPVLYQPGDGKNGLSLDGATLRAWQDGTIVGEAEATHDLETLLELYLVPGLLPDLSFAYGSARELELQLDAQLPLDTSMYGHLTSAEDRGYWSADRIGNNVFLLEDRLPADARPWAKDEDRGYGWEIQLPGFLAVDLDPILRRRAALFIEEALYGMTAGRIDDHFYQRKIDNIFSATEPMWPVPLPVIAGDPLPGTLAITPDIFSDDLEKVRT